MARLKSLKETWKEYGGWVVLAVTAYALWAFRGVFTALGGTASAGAEALTSGIKATADKTAQQAKIKQSTGTSTNYSDAQLAKFEADARTLAGYFGTLEGGGFRLFADEANAFALLKQGYPKLRLINNLPIVWTGPVKANGKRDFKNVTTATANCVTSPINYKVLVPFYKECTGGRELVNDVRRYITGGDRVKMLKWIL